MDKKEFPAVLTVVGVTDNLTTLILEENKPKQTFQLGTSRLE